MKRKMKLISLLCIVIILSQVGPVSAATATSERRETSFEEVMDAYHICISGTGGRMEKNSFQCLIGEIKDEIIRKKYDAKEPDSSGKIEISPVDIVEMDYYSKK